jgi:hypothetical protein
MKFLILLVIFVIFVFNSFSAYGYEFWKKYCDPSLTDTKIKALEKCERQAIEEVCYKPIFPSSLTMEGFQWIMEI